MSRLDRSFSPQLSAMKAGVVLIDSDLQDSWSLTRWQAAMCEDRYYSAPISPWVPPIPPPIGGDGDDPKVLAKNFDGCAGIVIS
eukprot:3702-Prymnesium_polylepis.1